MRLRPTEIPEVIEIEPKVFEDPRGVFLESWNSRRFKEVGLDLEFVQDNHSASRRGTLRGLHYQIVHPQGKLVRVPVGEVFDVAVDLRRSSASFGAWVGRRLSERNHRMLWIPAGFAHGFYVLSDVGVFLYKCTESYFPKDERTIRWNDADLGIEWPLIDGGPPALSEKDRRGVPFREADCYP